VKYDDDFQAYYVCLLCNEKLKTSLDCLHHYSEKHKREKKTSIYDLFVERKEREEVKANVNRRFRQSSLEEFLFSKLK
ncbi:MAG: hypothetical protein QXY09_05990, partial [Acidilobaceae archaeon]